jgi:radical SAM protein with 4Fe4S-binding SPASM domain
LLENTHRSEGFCYGLKSHIAILADGTVVPCCLDGNGVINLGNLHNTLLVNILHTKRVADMIDGFSRAKAVEELCLKCSYKERFKI